MPRSSGPDDLVSGSADRLADTRVPIQPAIAARWSPRMFDPVAEVAGDHIIALLEAARWAATWGHRQPVRFVVGIRGDDTFTKICAVLKKGNRYATAAGALMLVCADEGPDDRTALYAAVDAGAAIAQLTIEAVSRGLVSHPMAGFLPEAARDAFAIPEGTRPLAVIAIGSLGDYTAAPPEILERDAMSRRRLPLEDIAFSGSWGTAFEAPQE